MDSRCYFSFYYEIHIFICIIIQYIYIFTKKCNCVVTRSHFLQAISASNFVNGIVFTSDRYLIYRCTRHIILCPFRSFKCSVISTSVNKCHKHSKVTGSVQVTGGRFGFVDTGGHSVYFYSLVFPKSGVLLIETSALLFCCCERILYLKVS